MRLLWSCGGVDRAYVPRALWITLSTFLTVPLRIYERVRYDGIVRGTTIDRSPVFILGHWRTGTTHLHNLLGRDESMGYVSTFETIAPGFCLLGSGVIGRLLAWRAGKAHRTRVIDNIPLDFDAPQEEEFAVANMSPYSLIHQYSFPRRARSFFERYTMFKNTPASVRAEWIEIYLTILRKATLRTGGKRLVLKSPNHCARIATLLELFPDARFIHICRNPYHVFRSTRVVYDRVLPGAQLQTIGKDDIEAYILTFYERLMRKYLSDRSLIPAGRLVEVKFEDLEAAPLVELRRIYETLGLPGYATAEPIFRDYLSSIAGYSKNRYEIDDDVIEKVNRHWRFAFEAWGYPVIEPREIRGRP